MPVLSLSQNSKVFHGILIRGGVVERYLADEFDLVVSNFFRSKALL